ncbi:MAG: class I SAM-dependent methyltransferase [Chloroflexota bacterium]
MTSFDEWADLYDWVYAWKRDDIPFYVEEARRSGGPVLELGCGTGRVAIPMAQAEVEVVGLDNSAKMLQVARRKARTLGPINGKLTWVRGDMRSLSLDRKFALVIIPYRGFLSLLNVEEQCRCLEGIKAHLLPGGKLVFDIFVPDLQTLTDDSTAPLHSWDVTHPETGHRLVVWDQSRFDNHNQVINVRMIIEELDRAGEMVRKLYRDFQLRYIHRFEAQHLLALCGFHVLDLFGDFDRDPLDETSTDMVWVAEARE